MKKILKGMGIVVAALAIGGYVGWLFDKISVAIGTAGAIVLFAFAAGNRKTKKDNGILEVVK